MSAHFAAELPWPKVKALAENGAFALLPIGSTEAHGPHLPLGVDVVIAQEVCRRVALGLEKKAIETVVFPPLTYSLTDFAAEFSGTISLHGPTAAALLENVLEGIAGHKFRRIGVINHHLEPAHFKLVHQSVTAAAEKSGATIMVADHRRPPTGPQLGDEFMHGGSHAGHYETSLMLAASPHLVDESARRALVALPINLPAQIKGGAKTFREAGGPDAYFGDPASATAEEGERLFTLISDAALATLLT